ncbi:hypothetical protein BGZ97_002505 [Linnemannia gamsii]|uniref:Uncharacterized protein n=1 Tax=Linnemannia gamsii TaxID=64522 RepID=A0A9P6QUU3_9FUNG|nr:hypothetical protein BGZ97_002505 [Linnemannia gamsii]
MRTTIILAAALALATTATAAFPIPFADPVDNLYTISNSTVVSAKCRTCLIAPLQKLTPLCAKETIPPTFTSATPTEHLKCWDAIEKAYQNDPKHPFQVCMASKTCTLAETSHVQMYYIRQAETVRAELDALLHGSTVTPPQFANPVDNLFTISDNIISAGCKTCIYPLYQKGSPACAKESNPPSVHSSMSREHLKCWEELGKNATVYQPCVAQTACKGEEVTSFQGYVARQATTFKALSDADPLFADSGEKTVADANTTTTTGTTTGTTSGTAGAGKPSSPATGGAMGVVGSGKVAAFGAVVAMAAAGLFL